MFSNETKYNSSFKNLQKKVSPRAFNGELTLSSNTTSDSKKQPNVRNVLVINPITEATGCSLTTSQSDVDSSPKRTLASFKNSRPLIRCYSWSYIISWFTKIFMKSMEIMKKLNNIVTFLLKGICFYIIRLITSILLISIAIYIISDTAMSKEINEEINAFGLLSIVFNLAYNAMQTVLLLAIRKKIKLEKYLGDKPEAFQSVCIVYTLIGLTFYFTFVSLIKTAFVDYSFISLLAILLTILLIILDGIIMYLLYPIIFILLLGLLLIIGTIYVILYSIYYVAYKRCTTTTKEELLLKVKQNMNNVIDKVAYRYSKSRVSNPRNNSCGICLDSLEGRIVVSLDCNIAHTFHKKCIKDWLFKENACPLCKIVVMPEEIYDVI